MKTTDQYFEEQQSAYRVHQAARRLDDLIVETKDSKDKTIFDKCRILLKDDVSKIALDEALDMLLSKLRGRLVTEREKL